MYAFVLIVVLTVIIYSIGFVHRNCIFYGCESYYILKYGGIKWQEVKDQMIMREKFG